MPANVIIHIMRLYIYNITSATHLSMTCYKKHAHIYNGNESRMMSLLIVKIEIN